MDSELTDALRTREAFQVCHGAGIGEHLEFVRDVLRQTLELTERVRPQWPWSGYLAIDEATNRAVGGGGFTGNPTAQGVVELAYFTLPGFEGRGYATEMALRLTALARAEPEVRAVIAHTLPERNASCRVLEKAGFTHDGEIIHPEDGRVWRWRMEVRR